MGNKALLRWATKKKKPLIDEILEWKQKHSDLHFGYDTLDQSITWISQWMFVFLVAMLNFEISSA